jgi:phage baseplate assembly protein W
MPREILGFAMPFTIAEGQAPVSSNTSESVRASILRIISTRKGERAMRPAIGSRCWDFCHENADQFAAARLRSEVRASISSQEPRIRVLGVTVTGFDSLPEYNNTAGFRVDVLYSLGGQVETVSTDLDPTESA